MPGAPGTLTELGTAAARRGISVLWFWEVGLWTVVPGALVVVVAVLVVVEANVVVEVDGGARGEHHGGHLDREQCCFRAQVVA